MGYGLFVLIHLFKLNGVAVNILPLKIWMA